MPSGDYSSTISGGLKLKGGAKDAGIKKKKGNKRKKKEKEKEASATPDPTKDAQPSENDDDNANTNRPAREKSAEAGESRSVATTTTAGPVPASGKTEAQLRHEEIKRKRLDERLKREGGAKTHKQRVEELNKYLSTLSEHHDMPRIGPG